jgi:ubiquinone/menaquinone biosynthesis C-methylase UbiE
VGELTDGLQGNATTTVPDRRLAVEGRLRGYRTGVEPASNDLHGVRATYDTVARAYAAQLSDELDGKPLDLALVQAFLEIAGPGTVADVGCGPGHVTRFVAQRHPDVVGVDLSPVMIDVAREAGPSMRFTVGSMLALPAGDGDWAGIVAFYSIIHLSAADRAAACREFARVLRPGITEADAQVRDSREPARSGMPALDVRLADDHTFSRCRLGS